MTLAGLATRKVLNKKRAARLATAFPNGIRCQKCLEMGHFSYECKQKRKYVHRTSRTKQLNQNLNRKQTSDVIDCSADSYQSKTSSSKKSKENTAKKECYSSETSTDSSSSDSSSLSESEDESSSESESSSSSDSDSSDSDVDSTESSSSSSSNTDDSDDVSSQPIQKKLRLKDNKSQASSDDERKHN